MATTAADVLIDTLHDWGVDVVFGMPGDGINGIMEALRKRQDDDPLRPGAPRGVGRLHGVRLREVHRQARRLPGDVRAGRHPPAQRPLRRQARRRSPCSRSPGCRYHDLIGTHTQQDVELDKRLHRRRASTTTRIMGAGPRRERRRSRVPHRARLSRRRAHRRSRSTSRSSPSGAQRSKRNVPHHSPTSWRAARRLPDDGDLRARGRRAERGQEGRRSWPAAARSAPPTSSSRSPSAWPRRSSRRCSARRRSPTTARTPRAAIGLLGTRALAGGARGVRHAAHRRHARSRTSSSTRSRARRAAVQIDLDPARIGLRYPVEVGLVGDSRAHAGGAAAAPRSATTTAASSRRAQDGMQAWRELMEERGTRTDKPMKPQVVAWELGKRLARRRDRRPPTPAPSPRGSRGTSPPGAGRCTRCSGTLALDGERPALRDRRAARLPGAPVRRLRRRRRLLDADGRVRDLR